VSGGAVKATTTVRHAAGNFYVNDKPTGAVVAQQPFGGTRALGTNDKAGSRLNLELWVSPRVIKETFLPARNFRYPYIQEEQVRRVFATAFKCKMQAVM
jgi:1-pyrroline-5-carboxylate dehydrogenase